MPRQRANPSRDVNASARRRNRERAGAEKIDRLEIWRFANGICHICKCPVPVERFHLEHRIPLAAGGTHTADNLAPAHPKCNLKKADKTPAELEAEEARPGLRRTSFRRTVREVWEDWPEGIDPKDVF